MMAVENMQQASHKHIAVLLHEAIEQVVTLPSGIYIDATFGRGGHSQAILARLDHNGKLIAFDKDLEAVAYAKKTMQGDNRFTIIHASFAQMQMHLHQLGLEGKVQGILFDLGVSSPQIDNPGRGFSFLQDGQLDMRMDTTQGQDAMTWLAQVDEKTLADVLWKYGEERFSRRIARSLVAFRQHTPINSTVQLADLIKRAVPKKLRGNEEKHQATRSFQAIRIFINQELVELEQALEQAYQLLSPGGRLAVISFHSLEDRIVKQFIKQHEFGQAIPRGLPIKASHYQAKLKSMSKPIKASEKEVKSNPRARSAILRIAEKIL